MNYKILVYFSLIFLLLSCDPQNIGKSNKINFNLEERYQNTGFTLIYNESLDKIKKLDQRSFNIYHKSLKRNSSVKLTNLKNGKSLIAVVKSNRVDFPNFYNSVITNRIVENLELDINDPYIEIVLISKNSTFIAKKSKTFDEEKKVAQTAPIDGIQINDLKSKKVKKKKIEKKNYFYSIKIADFYYEDSAKMMIKRIVKETSLENLRIIKLSKTKYRVLIGPFNDIKSIRESFDKVKSLNFDNLEILKNV